jgi:hypothetical protein
VATSQTAIGSSDGTGLGYSDVARALLAREGLQEAQVRLLPWAEGGRAGVRCHVYVGNTGIFPADPRWVWWSPVVENPDQLQLALEDALRGRTAEQRHRRRRAEATLLPL